MSTVTHTALVTRYPFIITLTTGRQVRKIVTANCYANALNKVLALNPSKFTKTKYAKAMDLITAKENAKQESKRLNNIMYVLVMNSTGECSIQDRERTGHTTHNKFVAGKEVALTVETKPNDTVVYDGEEMKKKAIAKSKNVNSFAQQPEVVKEKSQSKIKVMSEVKTKSAKKAAPKKVAAKKVAKVPAGDKVARGNNMSLTPAEWVKVDALLKKEGVSFSAWSRGLVQAKIK